MGVQPGTDCALGNIEVGASAKDALGICHGVAEVEGGNGIEDELEWVCSVSSWAYGEAVLALGALEKWKRLQAVASSSFLDGVFRMALWADGVLLLALGLGHGGKRP